VSVKLSKTEIEVGKLYFEQGKKPKEIAELLGLSINTVYKAISKYRSYIKELERKGSSDSPTRETRDQESSVENVEVREKSAPKTMTDSDGNGRMVSLVEDRIERGRRVTTIISFRAHLPLVPVGPLEMKYENSRKPGSLTEERSNEAIEKVSECMLAIARELENIRDVLLKISERLENIKMIPISQNGVVDTKSEPRGEDANSAGDVPSFIKDNVWVDIIKSKYTSTD